MDWSETSEKTVPSCVLLSTIEIPFSSPETGKWAMMSS